MAEQTVLAMDFRLDETERFPRRAFVRAGLRALRDMMRKHPGKRFRFNRERGELRYSVVAVADG